MTSVKQVTINGSNIELYQIVEGGDYYLQISQGRISRQEGEFKTFKEAKEAYIKLVVSYL